MFLKLQQRITFFFSCLSCWALCQLLCPLTMSCVNLNENNYFKKWGYSSYLCWLELWTSRWRHKDILLKPFWRQFVASFSADRRFWWLQVVPFSLHKWQCVFFPNNSTMVSSIHTILSQLLWHIKVLFFQCFVFPLKEAFAQRFICFLSPSCQYFACLAHSICLLMIVWVVFVQGHL